MVSGTALGGESSDLFVDRSTQRGYGTARVTDNHRDCFNAERAPVFLTRPCLIPTDTLEVAPFFDLGKVSHSATDNPLDQVSPRRRPRLPAIAESFVVGFLDVGHASEGVSILPVSSIRSDRRARVTT